jgi:hypothetical protein
MIGSHVYTDIGVGDRDYGSAFDGRSSRSLPPFTLLYSQAHIDLDSQQHYSNSLIYGSWAASVA